MYIAPLGILMTLFFDHKRLTQGHQVVQLELTLGVVVVLLLTIFCLFLQSTIQTVKIDKCVNKLHFKSLGHLKF